MLPLTGVIFYTIKGIVHPKNSALSHAVEPYMTHILL